jgi:hypothetical protein
MLGEELLKVGVRDPSSVLHDEGAVVGHLVVGEVSLEFLVLAFGLASML